jgi:hypothetical protein
LTVYIHHRSKRIILNGQSENSGISKLLDVPTILTYVASLTVFKSSHQLSCEPFNEYFQIMKHGRNTRNDGYSVILPRVKLVSAKKGFFYQGASTSPTLSPKEEHFCVFQDCFEPFPGTVVVERLNYVMNYVTDLVNI